MIFLRFTFKKGKDQVHLIPICVLNNHISRVRDGGFVEALSHPSTPMAYPPSQREEFLKVSMELVGKATAESPPDILHVFYTYKVFENLAGGGNAQKREKFRKQIDIIRKGYMLRKSQITIE